MKNFSIIQVVLTGISVVAIAAAVIMFSLFRGGSAGSSNGTVVMWGTLSRSSIDGTINELESQGVKFDGLKYEEKDPATFEQEVLKAIAEQKGPDLILLNEKQIVSNENRIQKIPFKSFPLRDYQDLFFEESSLLVANEGIIGFPFLVDPLVLYYNKDMLTNAGYSKPPQTWTEVLAVAPILTQKDSSFNISKSTIALGAFDNINNAKDIYWLLTLQAGNPVFKRTMDQQNQKEIYQTTFEDNLNFTLNPAYAATNFFTQFSNPTKTIYSWNRSLPDSQTMFVSGDLAFYLGYASELPTLKRLNPNLNFDVTLVPQSQSSTRKATYGKMYTFVIPKTSTNIKGAMAIISAFTSKNAQQSFVKEFNVASVREDLLASSESDNPYQSVFNKSAIMAQGILEPDTTQTNDIIKELIETVVSGQTEISSAISKADQKFSLLLSNE